MRRLWRHAVNNVMLTLTGLCAMVTVSALFFILGYLLWNGSKSLDWAFFAVLFQLPGKRRSCLTSGHCRGNIVCISGECPCSSSADSAAPIWAPA